MHSSSWLLLCLEGMSLIELFLSVLQLETDHALGTNKGISEKSLGLEDILTTPIEHNNGEPAWHNKGACLQPTIGYRGACAQYHSILHQLQACIIWTVVLANADLASCQLRCIADGLNC